MNKVLLAVGLLSTSVAFSQTQPTKSASTTTNTSNYSTTDTQNYNSQNATMGTSSSTSKPTSGTVSPYKTSGSTTGMGSSTGTPGMTSGSYSSSSATGSYNSNSNNMGTGTSTTGTYSGTGTSGSYNSSGSMTTTPSTSGSYNTNSMGTTTGGMSTTNPSGTGGYNTNSTGTSTSTPSSGGYNTNSMGTGTSTTTPTTTDSYNSNTGTSTTTSTSTYSTQTTTTPYRTKDYKNFAYGIYAGVNTTRFRGESIDKENPAGRLGYQAGFFVRGGGRLYGQIGAEYFASSSNYFRPGDGQSAAAINDQINIQYVQIPVYIGFKLTESDRGISAIRLQAGAEYANRISSSSGRFNLSNSEVKSGSFNALGQLGFDIGAFLIDLTYHHGLSNAVEITNFQGSTRRILSASVGFKF